MKCNTFWGVARRAKVLQVLHFARLGSLEIHKCNTCNTCNTFLEKHTPYVRSPSKGRF